MGLLARPGRIYARRVSRIRTLVIRVGPFGRIRLTHRVIENVVRIPVGRVILRISARRLRKARAGLFA